MNNLSVSQCLTKNIIKLFDKNGKFTIFLNKYSCKYF